MTIEANRRAKQYAALYNDRLALGNQSWAQLARMLGVTYQTVYGTMLSACPPFIGVPEPEKRPEWSYPDAETLEHARRGRREIERADRLAMRL